MKTCEMRTTQPLYTTSSKTHFKGHFRPYVIRQRADRAFRKSHSPRGHIVEERSPGFKAVKILPWHYVRNYQDWWSAHQRRLS